MKGDSCEDGCPTGSRMHDTINAQKKDILFLLKQIHLMDFLQDIDHVAELCNKYKYEPF